MPVVCQHCQSEIAADGLHGDTVICSSCGSSVVLDTQEVTAGWLPESAPKRLGKFEILELLGEGAFGAVFKARDSELGRIVAMKIPRSGRAPSKEDTDRFLREARNAAALRHPCIVDLYDAGQIDGVCYLVSEYIQGTTLAERLSAKRYGLRQAAELVVEVADALEYAHKNGVVHRDIKPSNIMLDLEGRPHVMDFGLAKRAADEIHLTLEGQVLGTPAYMSPEQAKGEMKKVDARSDIYSLGVILYELLTGELPFRGKLRMLLVQVIQDEPRPPRRLNDRVPRDLETICLKAMAKAPASRYQTSGELAADLRRYLAGEPILARPIGAAERLWRWAKRRPAIAALLCFSALAAGGLLFGSLYYNARLNLALQNEKEHQKKAELNFQKAREAVDRMLTRVGESKEMEGIPEWAPYRQTLLEDALTYYKEFLQESDEPEVRREAGRAYERVGRIYDMLGKRMEAIDSVRHAIAIQEKLHGESPDNADDAFQLAVSYQQLGFLFEAGGKFAEAEQEYERSLSIMKELVDRFPKNQEYAYQVAITHRHLAFSMRYSGRKAEALPEIEKAITHFKGLQNSDAKDNRVQISLADSYGVKATMLRDDGKLDESLSSMGMSIDGLEEVLAKDSRSIEARVWLSWRLMERAETLVRSNKREDAWKDWERRVAIGEGQSHVDLRLGRAMALAHLRNYTDAVAEVESLKNSGQLPEQAHYNFACIYSLSVEGVRQDGGLSEPERTKLMRQFEADAMKHLKEAKEDGFFTPELISHLENDTDMTSLRERDDFKELLQELKLEAAKDK